MLNDRVIVTLYIALLFCNGSILILFFFISIVYESVVLLVYLSIDMNKNMGK